MAILLLEPEPGQQGLVMVGLRGKRVQDVPMAISSVPAPGRLAIESELEAGLLATCNVKATRVGVFEYRVSVHLR